MATKIRPLGKRVLIQRIEIEETSGVAGIIIPDSAKGKINYFEGKILDVGPDCKQVKVGEHVAFLKYGYDEVKVDNKPLIIAEENSIICVYE